MTVHLVSKELEGIHTELTLRWVDDHPIFVEAGKQQAKMLCMEVSIGTGDEKVVNVGVTKVKSAGDFVDEALECLGVGMSVKRDGVGAARTGLIAGALEALPLMLKLLVASMSL